MKVAFLGFISGVEEYNDKKTGALVRNASIASTNQMLKVRIGEHEQYQEMDSVLVCGDLKVFERNFYVENPIMRLSTAEDRHFMQGAPVPRVDGPGLQDMRALPKTIALDGGKVAVK